MTKFLSAIAIYAFGVFWGGFALSILWAWFMTPLGLPAITFAHAAGLQLLFLAFMALRGADRSDFDLVESLLNTLMLPLFQLGFGWCIHWLMLHA